MATTYTSRTGTYPEEGIKAPCVVSTSANITLSGEQTIGSTSCVAGDRVLVRSQTDTTENGIWLCAVGAWTRPTDWDNGNDVASGMWVTDAANQFIYIASFTGAFVAGTTQVTFTGGNVGGYLALASESGQVVSGNGLISFSGTGGVSMRLLYMGTRTDVATFGGDLANTKVASAGVKYNFRAGYKTGSASFSTFDPTVTTAALVVYGQFDTAASSTRACFTSVAGSDFIRMPKVANKAAMTGSYSEGDTIYSQADDGLITYSGAGTWLKQDGSAAT